MRQGMIQPRPTKYPPGAYRGFRARLPDGFIGLPTGRYQQRAVDALALRPGEVVLDAACGSGFNLPRLAAAIGAEGQVVAVEDNDHLLARARSRARGLPNVRVADAFEETGVEVVDGIIISYNPPILLQRGDLLESVWKLLRPGHRLVAVAGRATTPDGRAIGPLIRLALVMVGHGNDWAYWKTHEPWRHLEELAGGAVIVSPFAGFQYSVIATKPDAVPAP